jgi:transposase
MICSDESPSDPALLKKKLFEASTTIEAMSARVSALADERDAAVAQRDAARQENEKLLLILSQYKRALFGRRSERQDNDQLQLLLSGGDQGDIRVANENEPDATGKATASTSFARRQPRRNRGRLPLHLPRFDVVIDLENKTYPCCGGGLHKIGETIKEMLDIVPLQ